MTASSSPRNTAVQHPSRIILLVTASLLCNMDVDSNLQRSGVWKDALATDSLRNDFANTGYYIYSLYSWSHGWQTLASEIAALWPNSERPCNNSDKISKNFCTQDPPRTPRPQKFSKLLSSIRDITQLLTRWNTHLNHSGNYTYHLLNINKRKPDFWSRGVFMCSVWFSQ
jgi:hypothetical protein